MSNINGNDQNIFENDICMYLHLFCEEQNIDDLKKESQAVWNACLMYIYRHVFKFNKDALKDKTINNYNIYDFDILNDICDYYIYLCNMYDKEISNIGYSNLTGINQDTLNAWSQEQNRDRLTCRHSELYKKLKAGREESLSNKLASGKQNPVGVIAILNHHYNWSSPYTADSNKTAQARIERDQARLQLEQSAIPELPSISPPDMDK